MTSQAYPASSSVGVSRYGRNISSLLHLGRTHISSFWGSFGFENPPRRIGSPNIDHYHAVPLSDGHHVLFIDTKTDKLFMGCDAPLGGPIKLLRKVMLLPPSAGTQLPRLYTAAFDMSLGARIVAVYGDTLILYSIPPDVCNMSRSEQRADSWDVYTAPPSADEGRPENHWLNWWDEPLPCTTGANSRIWPVAIRGQEIGTLKGVCELAIHTKPDITIWGFALSSQ